MMSRFIFPLAAVILLTAGAAWAQTSATGGSGGSAAAGGTSASSLGTGGTSSGGGGTGSSLATGGAAAGGRTMSHSKATGGNGSLNGQSMNQAHQGGTFSKSHTHTHVNPHTGIVSSKTKSMSHEPGGKPDMSTSGTASK